MTARGRAFFQVRVAILGSILLLVVVYALHDIQRRRARTEWVNQLHIAVVLLELDNADRRLAPELLPNVARNVDRLEQRLNDEFRRYHPGTADMFQLTPYGPLVVSEAPPAIDTDSTWGLVQQTYQLWRYISHINTEAQVPSSGFDSVIYVVAEPVQNEELKFVEGFSQQGGKIGVTRIQLDTSTMDLCLFVVAHELLHTLGATDKYDAAGHTLIPEGLANPEQIPLYPQAQTEVMARNRVLSLDTERIPETLEELRVGSFTAREIGWQQ
jgi:hypothetical protein